MGPLVTAEHRARVLSYVEGASAEGATVVVDGRGDWPEGFFFGCTLLDGVRPGMRAYDDEIFGPVLSVVRVPSYEEAFALVNANPYGNGTARRSPATAARPGASSARSAPGMVGINVAIPVPVGFHSFGGMEGLALRGQRHVRPRGHPLLHPAQGGHHALARPGHAASSTWAFLRPADAWPRRPSRRRAGP